MFSSKLSYYQLQRMQFFIKHYSKCRTTSCQLLPLHKVNNLISGKVIERKRMYAAHNRLILAFYENYLIMPAFCLVPEGYCLWLICRLRLITGPVCPFEQGARNGENDIYSTLLFRQCWTALNVVVNTLWPNGTIKRHRSESTLDQSILEQTNAKFS